MVGVGGRNIVLLFYIIMRFLQSPPVIPSRLAEAFAKCPS
jgi:hypothetical protein